MVVTSFASQLWEGTLLNELEKATVASVFYNDVYKHFVKDYGDSIQVNSIGDINIYKFQDEQKPSRTMQRLPRQLLTIDQKIAFNFVVTDVEQVQKKSNILVSGMMKVARELALFQDDFLLDTLEGAIPNENRTIQTISNPEQLLSAIAILRTILRNNNVSVAGRILAMPPEAVEMLLNNGRVLTLANESFRNGYIGRMLGFDIYEMNALKNKMIAGHNSGATLAEQVPRMEAFQTVDMGDEVHGLHMYGACVTKPEVFAVAELNF